MSIGLTRATIVVLRKDLIIEWRTRARLNALAFFSIATLLLFSFAVGPNAVLLRQHAGGYLWLAITFASTLSLGESFRLERENASLDGLRLIPTEGRALFLGKALGNTVMLFGLSLFLLPFIVGVFDVTVAGSWPGLIAALLLGASAISAPGTVYAAIASNARARDVLLPLLLFPVLIPALLAGVKATTVAIEGDAMGGQLGAWLGLLAGFNCFYWALGFLLFPSVIEE